MTFSNGCQLPAGLTALLQSLSLKISYCVSLTSYLTSILTMHLYIWNLRRHNKTSKSFSFLRNFTDWKVILNYRSQQPQHTISFFPHYLLTFSFLHKGSTFWSLGHLWIANTTPLILQSPLRLCEHRYSDIETLALITQQPLGDWWRGLLDKVVIPATRQLTLRDFVVVLNHVGFETYHQGNFGNWKLQNRGTILPEFIVNMCGWSRTV